VPPFWIKLFSLTAAMANGCDIFSEGLKIIVSKNDVKNLTRLSTPRQDLFLEPSCIPKSEQQPILQPKQIQSRPENYIANWAMSKRVQPGEQQSSMIGSSVGGFPECEECALAKSK